MRRREQSRARPALQRPVVEIRLPDSSDPARAFHARHAVLYGYELREREIELVHVACARSWRRPRVRFAGVRARKLDRGAIVAYRRAFFAAQQGRARPVRCPVIDRASCVPANTSPAPALVRGVLGHDRRAARAGARVVAGSHCGSKFLVARAVELERHRWITSDAMRRRRASRA